MGVAGFCGLPMGMRNRIAKKKNKIKMYKEARALQYIIGIVYFLFYTNFEQLFELFLNYLLIFIGKKLKHGRK